ncbi:venom carboxylesterase-6-like [Teleopsis dalmanni]|uniref:venom carboxylesterase-6-like n=1 Tax=Teleopsis dalmanni TaxID=139649 RepID=UPI0018CDF6F8|nr:venom carboxylesterase-6-like [Teleopsis dalmanni]
MLIFIYIIFLIKYVSSESIEVSTDLGQIQGTTLESRLGKSFFAFRGIRYAQPPVAHLRFKNPLPVEPWSPVIFDATIDGPMCPQKNEDKSDLSEDCLRLNVYTRDLNASKPVVVYLHPGGFYAVSGQSKNFAGPQNLMDRDIVFVTMNYRLGTLGFLATGNEDAPGNAGLKDQVMALRWIQSHIKNFGGDPNSVTLFGYSAGSLSIGLHMLSPMAKGLFHRGIAMSASPLSQLNYEYDGIDLANRQAQLLNCTTHSVRELTECLKQKPMLDFVNSMDDMFDFNGQPILNWKPVIEKDFGQERYLIEDPYKTMLSGNIYKVPLITGITELEFMYTAYFTLINATLTQYYNDNFEKYAPIAFLYERGTPKSMEISKILRSEYLRNETLRFPDSLEDFGKLFSDAVIGFGYHRFLTLVSRFLPVYTYIFTYKGRYSIFRDAQNQTYGPVHHDELLYLLHVPGLTPMFKETDVENDTIERLTRMWTEFAKKGDPNNHEDQFLKNLNWTPYTANQKEYLDIGTELVTKTGGIYQDRYKIWDELFPIIE